MSGTLLLALTALTATAAPAPTAPAHAPPTSIISAWVRGNAVQGPRINLWLDHDEVYRRGDRARIYFRSDVDAYVTVVRIDTDGRIRVLFPIDPWEDNWARGGKTFEVLGRSRDEAFQVDDYPGLGYVFAIASEEPFQYDDIVRGDHWDYRAISDGRVRGDPYVAVSDLAERIALEGGYDYDVTSYSVEQHYDYPRFVCYDCHTYASWRYWDPYHSYCSRFRIVIYDDWYYYPYRHYRGGVVVVRPYRPGPRYVFKDYDGRNDYVTRVAERGRNDDRRPVERDRTSADVGGRGSIPAPVSPRRRTPEGRSPAAEPSRSPETRRPAERPRDRTAEPSTQPRDGRAEPRDARPDQQDSPRRRPSSGQENGGLRETTPRSTPPSAGRTSEEPRRRGESAAPAPRSGSSREAPSRRSAEPSTREPAGSRAEPSRSGAREARPQSREAPRERPQVREAPRERPAPRAEPSRRADPPRAEPSRGSSEPRSTGSPELKRRRPN